MNLDFLNDIKLDAVTPKTTVKRTATPKLPENADLRVFANGKIYPSKAFVEANNLEYQPKSTSEDGITTVPGAGVDIFDSTRWGMIMGKLPQELVFCAIVPRTQPNGKATPKIDLFGSCTYDEKGQPKASVYTQGAGTYGKKEMLNTLAKVYGIDWETTAYVDLKMDTEHTIKSPNNVYHLPKRVSSGAHKGEDTYIRRENLSIHPLVVAEVKPKEGKDAVNKQLDMFEETPTTPEPGVVTPETEQGTPFDETIVQPEISEDLGTNANVVKVENTNDSVDDNVDDDDDGMPDWAAGLGAL